MTRRLAQGAAVALFIGGVALGPGITPTAADPSCTANQRGNDLQCGNTDPECVPLGLGQVGCENVFGSKGNNNNSGSPGGGGGNVGPIGRLLKSLPIVGGLF